MATIIHSPLPKGTQLELLNVMAQVALRDSDDPLAGYILLFEDHKDQVKVYIPMGYLEFKTWVEKMHENLQGVVLPSPGEIARIGNGHRKP